MNNSELQFKLNKPTTDFFIKWNDTPTMRKLLILLYSYNYNFVGGKNYSTEQTCDDLKKEWENDFYKCYHKNSKPILHIFYNGITKKNELQFTTMKTLRTYPQYKKQTIYNYFGQ